MRVSPMGLANHLITCLFIPVDKIKPATKLRDIRNLCHPRPLAGDELTTLYVETEAARDPDCDIRLAIKSILDGAEKPQRILVCGHRGCGKSTELACMVRELGAGWFCVNFSVLEELPSIGIHAEEVLLAVTHQLIQAAKKADLPIEADQRLEKVVKWFGHVTKTTENGREAQFELEAGAKIGSGGWLLGLADLFAGFSSEIKYRTSSSSSIVEEVRKRPGDLIVQINRVVESIQEALRARNQQLLILVEDLDKLSIADARHIFVENCNLLTGISANIIYTIPIFTFYSPDAGAITAVFDHDFSLPMIKVLNPDGSHGKGFDIVKQIVHRRVDPSAIDGDALDLLIEKTGGVLRHVFEVLQTASSMTTLREPPIRIDNIKYALGRLKTTMGIQIALPVQQTIQGLDRVEQLYDKLVDYARQQAKGEPFGPTGDPIIQVLLQSCALVEYNGTRWLGVHPLVLEFLKERGISV